MRRSIVIDPIAFKRAKEQAKEAGMSLSAYIGYIIEGASSEIETAIMTRKEETKAQEKLERIREILNEEEGENGPTRTKPR